MLLYIITWTIIYFILILLLHNLYLFFQKNLTITKTKDYYDFPNKEYNKINNILNSNIKLSEKPEKKVKTNNTYINSDEQYNKDGKIFTNYDINLTSKNLETASEKNNTFDLEKFNLQFENNNMKGELEEFLNKLNN
jgi:hypothetical protein